MTIIEESDAPEFREELYQAINRNRRYMRKLWEGLPSPAVTIIRDTLGALDPVPDNAPVTPSATSHSKRYVPATGTLYDPKITAEILRLRNEGMERVDIAKAVNIGRTNVGSIIRNALRRGEIQPISRLGKPKYPPKKISVDSASNAG